MRFVEPIWLLFGFIACLALAWRYRSFDRAQNRLLTNFVSARLARNLTRSLSPGRRRFKRALFLFATACLFVALARPQAGYRWEETKRKGLEILFAVDTSKSMLAQDVKPNRLTRAKLAVEDLLDQLNGDGVGLVAFAGDAFLQCPVTLDYNAFRESVDALDTSIIPRGGTDIAAAIHEAQAAFKVRADSDKILVLITDGEDLGDEGVSAAKTAAKDGVKIFTVGVGSTSGELIPVPSENGGTEFLKDDSGQFVKSRLDEKTLRQIASATGGIYEPLGQQGQGLTAIYERGMKSFTRHDLASRRHKVYLEQYHWPLVASLLLFFVEPLIGTRRRMRAARSEPTSTRRLAAVPPAAGAFGLMLAFLLVPGIIRASPGSAEKAYQKGDFSKAVKDYASSAKKQPANAQLQFNVGAAAYKAGEFDSAQKAFEEALKTEELPVQQSAYYNLGNSQYRIGQKSERAMPQETIKTWQAAVQSYEAALQINPKDADAKYNRDLVKRKLEQLQKQQKQQQQQNQKNRKNDQQKDQKKDQQKQSSQDKSQNSKQNQKKDGQNKPDESKQQKQEQPQAPKPEQSEPKKPSQGTPEANAKPDQQKSDQQAQAPERRKPGEMTKEEAQRLLDSLRNQDAKVSTAPLSRGSKTNDVNRPFKDW